VATNIGDILMYVVFPLVGMVCLMTLPWAIPLFWKKMLPAPARLMFWAARRKHPLALVVHDSGRSELTTIVERMGDGVVITPNGKYKILPRFVDMTTPSPRQLENEEIQKQIQDEQAAMGLSNPGAEGVDPAGNQDGAATSAQGGAGSTSVAPAPTQGNGPLMTVPRVLQSVIGKSGFFLDLSDWVVKRSILIGIGVPLFVGYSGKICLLNPEALALYEAAQMYIRTDEGVMYKGDKDSMNPDDVLQPLLLLDPRKIKTIVDSSYDDAQIAAIAADSELIGAHGRGLGKYSGLFIILAVVLIAGLAIFILPQFLGGR